MNIADEIDRLHKLHQSGALTDAEFAQAKEKLLAGFNAGNTGTSAGNSNAENRFAQLNYLRRSKTDQWIGGVCGGLGKFTGMQSWIWRLMFVIFVACFGFGIIFYLLAWIFIPEED